jgi:hypothetical protein
MIKYLLFFIAMQFSINCFSQNPASGQLKITLESFKCINQSYDGLIEFDGHGNEIFLNFGYRIYSPSNVSAAKSGAGFTNVFGSNVNGQTQVGTASAIGGIANGDVVNVNILALNEHVDADNIIAFSPSVWEWDNSNNTILNLFNSQLAVDFNWLIAQPYPFANTGFSGDYFSSRFIKIGDKYPSYWPLLKYNNILKPVFNVQENRPIGAKFGPLNGENFAVYNPAMLLLDTKILSAVYRYNKSIRETNHPEKGNYISDITEMIFTEETYAIKTSNGSYSLKLKIEFTPDAITTNPAPSNPTRIINNIKKDMPVKIKN